MQQFFEDLGSSAMLAVVGVLSCVLSFGNGAARVPPLGFNQWNMW